MEIKTYDNKRFDNYDMGGLDRSVVKGQFENGCADPYIMRYNGMFYLYITTSGLTNFGLRAWKSKDLLHWKKCTGKGCKEGYVVKEYDDGGRFTRNAYAPEVYYYNGKFYLIISPGEAAVSPTRGHRILVSNSPEGPFEKYTDQIDLKIDGTVLIDDDETVYFAHATPKGITIHHIEDMKALTAGAIIPASDGTGAWTEGPGLCKIRGWYYLTYTGCHYQTPGYQVLYAVTDKLDPKNDTTVANSFIRGANNPILLNCDKEEGHVGLGHSINFLGPDLDSTYICYHNLDHLFADGMTHRSFNIDRLLASEGYMTGTSNITGSIYPKWPFFQSYSLKEGFEEKGNLYLSSESSKKRFTAEYNVKRGEGTVMLFSYKDENNYGFLKADYRGHSLILGEKKNGVEKVLATGALKLTYSYKDNQTFRLAYDGTMNVYFNNMLKITLKYDFNEGKIGYLFTKSKAIIGYSAISDEANGSSDRNEIKQALGDVPACLYQIDGGTTSLSEGSGARKVGGVGEFNYTTELYFAKKGDVASYPINVKDTDLYGINLTLNKKALGEKVVVAIDGKEYVLSLPKPFEVEEDVVRVLVKVGMIEKGVHNVEIKAPYDGFSIVSFSFAKMVEEETFKNDLKKNADGITFRREGYFFNEDQEELHVSGKRAFASFTSRRVKDFELNLDLKITDSDTKAPIGVIFRQNHYAPHEVPGQNFIDFNTHIQGYFLEMGKDSVSLWRYNFGNTKSYLIKEVASPRKLNVLYHLRIVAIDNTFEIYIDNELIMKVSVAVAFTHGAVGLYSIYGSGSYKNIDFKTLG